MKAPLTREGDAPAVPLTAEEAAQRCAVSQTAHRTHNDYRGKASGPFVLPRGNTFPAGPTPSQ